MNLNYLVTKSCVPPSHLFNHQIVRWLRPRKPFWLGIAKSKMFKIPQPKRLLETEEEREMINYLHNVHKTYVRSLIHFMTHDNPSLKYVKLNKDGDEIQMAAFLEKEAESLKANDAWNAESARLREERLEKQRRLEMETAIKEISEFEEKKRKHMEIIEEIVRKEKELSETYVTPENLDEAVEKCLNNVECFDFAIDLDGNIYHGRETLQVPVGEESKAQ